MTDVMSVGYTGNVGIGVTNPSSGMLQVNNGTGTTGLYVGTNASRTVPNIRSLGYSSNGTDAGGGIELGNGSANSVNMYIFRRSDNDFTINTSGADTSNLYIQAKTSLFLNSASGNVFIGDTTNGNMAEGLTINQQANDDEILTLKSSDVSHGVDGVAESDTYGLFRKYAATQGGLEVLGIGEIEVALQLTGISTSADTGKTTGDNSPVKLIAQLKSGTGVTDMSANGNLVTIANNATTRFIFDAEGTGHADDVWTDNAFDLAEDYPVKSGAALEAGDVVSLVENPGVIDKTNSAYSKELLGVVSYHTAQLSATLSNDQPRDAYGNLIGYKPIALSGRVPVKVTTENGEIKRGDYLTSSSTTGFAMKATKPGIVIGRALEDYAGPGSSGEACQAKWQKEYNPLPSDTGPCQKILAFVNVSFADPTGVLSQIALTMESLQSGTSTITSPEDQALGFGPFLVGAIQEQQKQIDALKISSSSLLNFVVDKSGKVVADFPGLETLDSRITTLESTVSDLKTKLTDLESRIATPSAIPSP